MITKNHQKTTNRVSDMLHNSDLDQMEPTWTTYLCNISFRKSGRLFNRLTLFDIYFEIV